MGADGRGAVKGLHQPNWPGCARDCGGCWQTRWKLQFDFVSSPEPANFSGDLEVVNVAELVSDDVAVVVGCSGPGLIAVIVRVE